VKISQRQAKQWRKRALAAEDLLNRQRSSWVGEWPGGVQVAKTLCSETSQAPLAVATARRLAHAVVVTAEGRELSFYALPLAKARP
jgi:hypothetical protein